MNLVPRELLAMSPPLLLVFLLALARVGALFMLAPVFGSQLAPVRVRAVLVFCVTVAMVPLLPLDRGAELLASTSRLGLVGAVAREVLVGSAIGLTTQFVFGGVQMAGQLGGIQMGAGLSNLIDPQSGARLTAMAQWANVVALLVFLAVDAHHLLIRAVAESFNLVAIGGGLPSADGIGLVLVLSGGIFVIAMKVAAPVMLLVLLVNVAMGVLAKVIPQLNVFIVGFPLNVAAGLFGLMAALPFVVQLLVTSFDQTATSLVAIMRGLG
jgi:flagellar biosynthesis protein FliR